MSPLCRFGWHHWRVVRTRSLRYCVLVTDRCRRCSTERERSVW